MIRPEQERQAEAIFKDVIAVAASDRGPLLDERCGADIGLRAYVEELLALHDDASGFLENPPSAVAGVQLRYEEFAPERLQQAAMPQRIGHFVIKGVLGRGGMGTVYLAESDRPRRLVALKVIRADAASPSTLRRFEHEAQVLALLQHPGIAQVYETGLAVPEGGAAGAFAEAQPYFAMELVEGLPLTDYAAEQKLAPRARLALVARICDAVQHAHMKGVVHRDLKPGNILVAHGGVDSSSEGRDASCSGLPKVLDFGVARLTDADVQVTTMQTNVGQLIGTVAYMSPEQVTGDPNGVDTRSDVYALGVILYELLTGQLPHRVRNVAITEALRTIREDDPTPLSATDRMLRGDVDTIVRKALEKEPARRYQSAAELAADIRRYLNDEPITARPPSARYHLAKFTRRHRTLVGGVAAAFCILVLGVLSTTRMAIIAMRNEQRAIEKSNSYARNSEFHEELLPRIARAVDADDGGSVVEVLQIRGEALPLRYAGRPLERAVAERTLGTVYWVLDEFELASEHLRAAVHAYEQFAEPTDRDYLRTLAVLAQVKLEMEDLDEAGRLIEGASRIAASALPASDQARIDVESVRAGYLYEVGRTEEAEQALRQLVDQQRVLATEGDDRAEVALIQTIRDLGEVMHRKGHLDVALGLYREALDRRMERPDMGPNDPDTLVAMERVAALLRDIETRESMAEAEVLYERACEGLAATLGPEHFATIGVQRNLATLLWRRACHETSDPTLREADLARAHDLLTTIVELERRRRGETHSRTLSALNNLVAVQFDRARMMDDAAKRAEHFGEAAATFTRIMQIRQQTLPSEHRSTNEAANNAARALLFQARALRQAGASEARVLSVLREAEDLQRRVVEIAVSSIGDADWTTGHFEDRYAEILLELGRTDEAAAHAERAVRILEGTYGAEHARTKEARDRLTQLTGLLEASRK